MKILPETSISEITSAKRTGNLAQTVEHLLCKHKAQIQTPITPKQKKKKTLKAFN
jgi:hypothetical protein